MLLKELIDHIDTKGTSIYFYDSPIENCDYCYSRTTTSEELSMLRRCGSTNSRDEKLGVHLLNVELKEIYAHHCETNPAAIKIICSMLKANCISTDEKIEGAYGLYTVLHEIGHWQHLVESGLSRADYWKKYEGQRDLLWKKFQKFV